MSAYTLILRTQLVGEIMIEPYRVMIEPYQSVFVNKLQLNYHLYMIKYMHFELCVYVSIVLTFTFTTNPKITYKSWSSLTTQITKYTIFRTHS